MRRLAVFAPLVVLFGLMVFAAKAPKSPLSDSSRYLWFAENLTKGYFSPQTKVNLWNGPGYPIVLLAIVGMHNPYPAGAAINAVLMLFALTYFYYTARQYVREPHAVMATYVLALWPPVLKMIPSIMTEPLSVFLACGFAFHLSRVHREGTRHGAHMAAAAAFLAYLALTRVIFGYVIPATLAALLVLYLVSRRHNLRRDLLICAMALAFCLPYLYYTYSITGEVYYWGTSGGLSLYWMSSPVEGELGDWHVMRSGQTDPNVAPEHGLFFSNLGKLSSSDADKALRQKAVENIREHPGKYLKNWIANVGRLLIGYPRARPVPKLGSLLDVVPGMFLTVVAALSIYPTYAGRKRIPHSVWIVLLVTAVYVGGSTLLSALPRFMVPVTPYFVLWIALVASRIVKIQIRR